MVDKREMGEIRKLPPKERIQKLKALEAKRKKEEADLKKEAQQIMEESLKEIKLDEMLQEIEVNEDNADLDKADVKKLLDQIEEIEEEEDKKRRAGGGDDYGRRIQELLPQNTMDEIHNWYQQDNVPPSRDEFLEVYENARQAYETVQQTMEQRPDQDLYSAPSQELVENVVSSMKTLRALGYKKGWFDTGGP